MNPLRKSGLPTRKAAEKALADTEAEQTCKDTNLPTRKLPEKSSDTKLPEQLRKDTSFSKRLSEKLLTSTDSKLLEAEQLRKDTSFSKKISEKSFMDSKLIEVDLRKEVKNLNEQVETLK